MMGRIQRSGRRRGGTRHSTAHSSAARAARIQRARRLAAMGYDPRRNNVLGMRVPLVLPGKIQFHETVKADWKSEKGSGWQAACYSMRVYKSAAESYSCRIEVQLPVKAFDVKEKVYRYINRGTASAIASEATFKVGLKLAESKNLPKTHAALCILLRDRMKAALLEQVAGAEVNAGPHTLNKKQCTS